MRRHAGLILRSLSYDRPGHWLCGPLRRLLDWHATSCCSACAGRASANWRGPFAASGSLEAPKGCVSSFMACEGHPSALHTCSRWKGAPVERRTWCVERTKLREKALQVVSDALATALPFKAAAVEIGYVSLSLGLQGPLGP